jgi:hypothetical protein
MAGAVKITLLGRRPAIDFLRPLTKDCLDYEQGGWHRLFSTQPSCKDSSFPETDKVISFISDPSGTVSRGLESCLGAVPVHSFPPFPPDEEKTHVASYLASCLQMSGLPVSPEKAIEDATKKPLLGKERVQRSQGIIVFHPGSGSNKKNYPPDLWIDLIRNAGLSIATRCVLLLGPAEEGLRHFFTEEFSGEKVDIVYAPSVNELLALLRGTSLYVGHDSGVTHLSAMLGTPTVALFKSSDPSRWMPLGPEVTVIPPAECARYIYSKINEKIRIGRGLT